MFFVPRRARGFTLIEMVITVAIIGLVATITFPLAELTIKRGKERDLRDALQQVRSAIDAYKLANEEGKMLSKVGQSGYPPSLQVLVEGVADVKSPNKDQKIYFLRRIPRDPFASDPSLPAENTWGKRSYASSADSPREGDDVYDIYPLTDGVGINGIPYRKW